MKRIAVVTTFPNFAWDIYAKQMLESFVRYWPKDVPLMVQLDDDLLYDQVDKTLRPQDGIAVGRETAHEEFVSRHQGKDDKDNYRKQPVRFCHKVFALKRALGAALKQREVDHSTTPQYFIWLDADVLTTRTVSMEDLVKCLPRDGDAVAYLGRKDWDHSECGWLVFDLEHGGDKVISAMTDTYISDKILDMEQQHDSWVFDKVREHLDVTFTNLTENKPGNEIWPHSPMASWSVHYKGPIAKQKLHQEKNPVLSTSHTVKGSNFQLNLQNAIPDDEIRQHIEENQKLIKNWLQNCKLNNETIVVASAGPSLTPEDLEEEVKANRKIVVVKHSLKALKAAGIKPWACILLDPRPHVLDFVTEADNDVLWFVASQVNPSVTKALLLQGCQVWGYHASINAPIDDLINKQANAIVHGGTATATRGLYLLKHLGFHNFKLYGYDLSYSDKPDMNAADDKGQPKYLEFTVGLNNAYVNSKRIFYTEPQFMAQFNEMYEILQDKDFKIEAYGDGTIPYLSKLIKLTNLRKEKIKYIINPNPVSYYRMLKCKQSKMNLSTILRRIYRKILRKQ